MRQPITWNLCSYHSTKLCGIHTEQIERYSGSDGIRDAAALESAIATPQMTFGGQFLHPTIAAMAAACLFHLCQNHPFTDGNKRVGANAAITFLLLNGWEPRFQEDELVAMVLSVAPGGMSKPELIEIFETRCQPLQGA